MAKTFGWVVFFVVAFELGLSLLLRLPQLEHSSIATYFYYGLSTEQRIRDLAATPDLPPDSILYAGWLGDDQGDPGRVDIAVYGNSYAAQLEAALAEARPELRVRNGLGPGAPVTHAHALYLRDREQGSGDVVVLGVASSYQFLLQSMTPDTVGSDQTKPYGFPRYGVRDGELVVLAEPVFATEQELIAGLADPARWQAYLDVLDEYDDAYNRFVYAHDPLDASAIGRLLRRTVQKSHRTRVQEAVHGREGFEPEHETSAILRALLVAFAKQVRADGGIPVVMLFSDGGFANHLYELVDETLATNDIPFVNSFDICPATDLASFSPDGIHFTHDCNRRFAEAVLQRVAEQRGE